MKKKITIYFAGFLFLSLFISRFLLASIMVSPVRFEVKIQRGKTFTDAIRVRNMKSAEINVKVYVSDFFLNEEGSLIFLKEGTHENSLSRWIRVNPTQFKLKVNEEKWVRFSVRMPENIDGEHHGMIFFQTIPSGMEEAAGKQVFISTRIGAVVYASPGGNIKTSAEVTDFFVKENLEESTISYSIILHNKGKIHVRPKGKLKILDSKGKKITTSLLNEQGSPILRENWRIFKGRIGSNIKPGNYRIIAELEYGGKTNLEAEKPLNILPEIKIEAFEAKTSGQSKIIFSTRVRGFKSKGELDRSFVRVKDIKGKLHTQVPLGIKNSGEVMNLEGEWNRMPEAGIYFAELVLLPRGKKALISYVKFVVK